MFKRSFNKLFKRSIAIISIMIIVLNTLCGCSFSDTMTESSNGFVWGIDISRYQEGLTDEYFEKLKQADCKFIYIQFGLTNSNATLEEPIKDFSEIAYGFAEQAEKNEIYFGFYYLTEATSELYKQAEFAYILKFLKDVEEKGYKYNKLPLMLDHEVKDEEQYVTDLKIQKLVENVQDLKKFDIKTIVYTSESRYTRLHSELGSEQDFWLADYNYINGTGIAPEKNEELIPDFLKSDNNVQMWQYAVDSAILGERFTNVTSEDIDQNIAIDRNLMKKEYFDSLIS